MIPKKPPLVVRLEDYLGSWGLREFHNEASYFQWQRTSLSQEQLLAFERLVHRRSKEVSSEADIEFYDLLAQPAVLPVLYSQRYDYYRTLGEALCSRLAEASRVLDFGCGVGLLTTFFAQEFPAVEFVGVDRSAQSLVIAEGEAKKRQVKNVAYHHRHIPDDSLPGYYDLILSTQAVFQYEGDPGLPSRGWQTFQRPHNLDEQVKGEARFGLIPKLDVLQAGLLPHGRMLLFEKTTHLGRRILFQRALSRRGFNLLHAPLPISYYAIDEHVLDGPLYEVSQTVKKDKVLWSEEPIRSPGNSLYGCGGRVAAEMSMALLGHKPCDQIEGKSPRWGKWRISIGTWCHALGWVCLESRTGVVALLIGGMADFSLLTKIVDQLRCRPENQADLLIDEVWGRFLGESAEEEGPGYENHTSTAQEVYEALPSKVIQKEFTSKGEGGKAMHWEFGQADVLWYFYWANTFDQRQLVLVCHRGAQMLRTYFEDSLRDALSSAS